MNKCPSFIWKCCFYKGKKKKLLICASKEKHKGQKVFLWGVGVEPILPSSLLRLPTQIKLFEHHSCGDTHTLI